MKQINGYSGYFITEEGQVVSRKGKVDIVRKLTANAQGYLRVTLQKGGSVQTLKRVHRLVAEAFIPNPEGKRTVNHINGNKADNRVENLEWATHSENNQHAVDVLSRPPPRSRLGLFGKDNPTSKKILQLTKSGDVIAEFYGAKEVERDLGIFAQNVTACCRGKAKSAGGFVWRYA